MLKTLNLYIINSHVKRNKTQVAMATIKQPEWCDYPDAAVPFWGCWSLLTEMVESEGYCKKCELYKKK